MPYSKWEDVNPAVQGIKPKLTLAQANKIAEIADSIKGDDIKNPWAVAIAQFKKSYRVKDGRWVKKEKAVSELAQVAYLKIGNGSVLLEDAARAFEKLRNISQSAEAEALDMSTSLSSREAVISAAFYGTQPGTSNVIDSTNPYWVRDVFMEHPELGSVVVVAENGTGKLYAVPFTESDDGPIFEARDSWLEVRIVYEVVGSEETSEESAEAETIRLSESASSISILSEGAAPDNGQGPLTMLVNLIEPGFGNTKDGHYYPRETLRKSAGAFVGAKMFETDHKADEKNNRTWVSTVRAITGFSDTGAPVAEVVVHDPGFAARVRNLDKADMLGKLACSIFADGVIKPGTVDGKAARIVSEIMASPLPDVDWVTRAGAGGRAVSLMESDEMEAVNMEDKEKKEDVSESKSLTAVEVTTALLEAGLPNPAALRLAGSAYSSKESLDQAIEQEKGYIESLAPQQSAGSSRPFGMGESEQVNEPSSETETVSIAEQETAILAKYGLGG